MIAALLLGAIAAAIAALALAALLAERGLSAARNTKIIREMSEDD